MSGIEDRAHGEGTELKEQAREAAGRATGDPGLRARGEAEQAKGKSWVCSAATRSRTCPSWRRQWRAAASRATTSPAL